jgi:pimeloyl-ACP methyl ester carboxylesterase
MFEGFTWTTIETGETAIHVCHGGSGPPLLLLHGHPQTHAMWHLVAPRLAQDFTVVAPRPARLWRQWQAAHDARSRPLCEAGHGP